MFLHYPSKLRRDLILDCAKVNDHAQSIFLSIWTQKEGENVTRQFKTVEFEDRKTIAAMYAAGAVAEEIAQKIGVSRSTVYTELKRGQDGVTLDKNFAPLQDNRVHRDHQNHRQQHENNGKPQLACLFHRLTPGHFLKKRLPMRGKTLAQAPV